jgi:hypothetical protein
MTIPEVCLHCGARIGANPVGAYATVDTLRHDEALLSVARKILTGEQTITVAPVIGPHSIDLITFEKGLIRFIEIKGAHGSLSPLEAKVKQLVESQPPLKYEVVRYGVPDKK